MQAKFYANATVKIDANRSASARKKKKRLENLSENKIALWGEMTSAQMMAHCSMTLENAMGESYYKNTLLLRFVAPLGLLGSLLNQSTNS